MIALLKPTSRKKPRVPAGIRIYAVGDIHGRADLLESVLSRIDADLAANPVSIALEVYLGDYIDRGPSSQEVINQLLVRSRTFRAVFLKGNHEVYLTGFISDPTILDEWRQFGGIDTLRSYGIALPMNGGRAAQARVAHALEQKLPITHRQFFAGLKSSFACGDYFFVHAGVRPGVPLTKQNDEDLLWIRADFLFCEDEFSKIIVHGHTPVPEPEIRSNRINIDTGAYATGRLTCLKLENDLIAFI